MKARSGWTLVELIVVLGVMALLAILSATSPRVAPPLRAQDEAVLVRALARTAASSGRPARMFLAQKDGGRLLLVLPDGRVIGAHDTVAGPRQ